MNVGKLDEAFGGQKHSRHQGKPFLRALPLITGR